MTTTAATPAIKPKPAPRNGKTAVAAAKDRPPTRAAEDFFSAEQRQAWRLYWEGDVNIQFSDVCSHFSVSSGAVYRERMYCEQRGDPWTKTTTGSAKMTELAHSIADKTKTMLDQLGPSASDEEKADARRELNEVLGVEARAKVLEKHRKEWAAPRKLAYEAIQARDFDRAKLAKISSETLKIIQEGERKAWGMDKGESGEGVTVVIDRS